MFVTMKPTRGRATKVLRQLTKANRQMKRTQTPPWPHRVHTMRGPVHGIYAVLGRSLALAGGNEWSPPGQLAS
jgi:hypothetical protein